MESFIAYIYRGHDKFRGLAKRKRQQISGYGISVILRHRAVEIAHLMTSLSFHQQVRKVIIVCENLENKLAKGGGGCFFINLFFIKIN